MEKNKEFILTALAIILIAFIVCCLTANGILVYNQQLFIYFGLIVIFAVIEPFYR
jgi:hypothetical protein